MATLTPEQVERILSLTDSLELGRDAVIVPLKSKLRGGEVVLPDGKLLIEVPTSAEFELWFSGLEARLRRLPLDRVPKAMGIPKESRRESPLDVPTKLGQRYIPWAPQRACRPSNPV